MEAIEALFAVAAAFIARMPAVISVASDVVLAVNAVKAGDSIYQAIDKEFPVVSDAIKNLAKVFPKSPAVGELEHLDNVAKALFSQFAYSPDQLAALKPYLPENTGGGSIGYNQQANA